MWETIRNFIQRERGNLSGLSLRKKLGYFWDYYRYWALLALGLAVALGFGIYGLVYNNQPVRISGLFLNVDTEPAGYDWLSDGYLTYLNKNRARADVIEMICVEYTQGEQTGNATGSISGIDSLVAACSLDYIIMDETALTYFGPLEMCADLETVLTPEQRSALDGKLFSCYGLDRQADYYAAIDISDSPFAQKFGLSNEPAYLIIVINTPRTAEELTQFLDYFFQTE